MIMMTSTGSTADSITTSASCGNADNAMKQSGTIMAADSCARRKVDGADSAERMTLHYFQPIGYNGIMMKRIAAGFLICLVATAALVGQRPSLDKFVGTWELNVADSKIESTELGPGVKVVRQTIKIERTSTKLRIVSDTELSDGRASRNETVELNLDGKPVVLVPGSTALFTRIDNDAFEVVLRINNKDVNFLGRNRFVVSANDKILNETKTQQYRQVVSEDADLDAGTILKSSTSVLLFEKR
jgi:hypothetical protein